MIRGMMTPSLIICLAVFSFLIIALSGHSTQAQSDAQGAATPTSTPESEELRRLRERNAILTEKKKAVLLENEILEARFPKPSATPLEGKTTVSDSALIENQALSYAALARIADEIICQLKILRGAACVRNTTPGATPRPALVPPARPLTMMKLAIYEGNEINQLLGYGIAKERLRLMGEEYKNLLAPPPPPKTQESAIAPLHIARSFLGAVVDLTALMRTNVDIKGYSFTLEKASLVSEVFRAAKETGLGADLYYPAEFPPNVDVNARYEFLARLEQLHGTQSVAAQLVADWMENEKKIPEAENRKEARKAALDDVLAQARIVQERLKRLHYIGCPSLPERVAKRIKELEELLVKLQGEEREQAEAELRRLRSANCCQLSADMELQIEDLETLFASLKAKEEDLRGKLAQTNDEIAALDARRNALKLKLHPDWRSEMRVDEAITRLNALNDQFDQFVAALALVDDATGLNLLTSYLKTERMSAALSGDGVYWLQLQVVKAGGNNRIKTNFLVDIFTGGARLSHSGGAIVQYILYHSSGKAVAADTIPIYTGYIKSKKVEELFR